MLPAEIVLALQISFKILTSVRQDAEMLTYMLLVV